LFHTSAADPDEWRCLSRRDALRIAEEMQLLIGAATEAETHLPAVADSRLFRRAAREIEGDLAERLARVESKVDQHSAMLGDLRSQSAVTEQSFRNLLSAVENFCDQAAQQIERVSPAALAAPAVQKKKRAPVWAIAAIAAVIGAAAIVASWRMWPARPAEVVAQAQPAPAAVAAPVGSPVVSPVETPRPASMRIEIASTEPAWISLSDLDGERLAVGMIEPGKGRTVEIDRPATLRTGNAGGLIVHLNGKPLGPIGPRGKVREIAFKDGSFTITSPE